MRAPLARELRDQFKTRNVVVRVGDRVKVLKGDYTGKIGRVMRIFTAKLKVAIAGISHKNSKRKRIPVLVHANKLVVLNLGPRRPAFNEYYSPKDEAQIAEYEATSRRYGPLPPSGRRDQPFDHEGELLGDDILKDIKKQVGALDALEKEMDEEIDGTNTKEAAADEVDGEGNDEEEDDNDDDDDDDNDGAGDNDVDGVPSRRRKKVNLRRQQEEEEEEEMDLEIPEELPPAQQVDAAEEDEEEEEEQAEGVDDNNNDEDDESDDQADYDDKDDDDDEEEEDDDNESTAEE